MDGHDDHNMSLDAPAAGDVATQETQSRNQQIPSDTHLWGYLQPCRPEVPRIDFWKMQQTYNLGRNPANDIVLSGVKVSNKHCSISWNGSEEHSDVTVTDYSSNGTFINGAKIGKGRAQLLRDGTSISFGTTSPQPDHMVDYRYIFRHTAGGTPQSGLYRHYDISHELGKGSFATVMRALHKESGVWFAVKIINNNKLSRSASVSGTHEVSSQFAREIAVLEKLSHPNICQLKEVFWDATNINLVLELVPGGDLLEHIFCHNGLTENATKHILYQICDALKYIHAKGITHRDLKPENVLITRHKPPIIKVADFGLAKMVDSMTMLRTMCGTPSYLAPEVVLQTNQEGYDSVVDSWSVGVITFSMLTVMSPFIEDDTADLKTKVRTRVVDWTALNAKSVSEAGRHFINGLLQGDPKDRLTSEDAMGHPWLQSYVHVYPLDKYGRMIPPDLTAQSASANGEGDHEMSDVQSNGANPIRRQGSNTLVRRSEVVQAAEEGGYSLMTASDEMLYGGPSTPTPAANNNGGEAAGPSRSGGDQRNTHLVDSIDMMQVEEEDDGTISDSTVGRHAGKLGKTSESEKSSASGMTTRSNSKAMTTRSRATRKKAAAAAAEEAKGRPRRSTRQTPQKAGRR